MIKRRSDDSRGPGQALQQPLQFRGRECVRVGLGSDVKGRVGERGGLQGRM